MASVIGGMYRGLTVVSGNAALDGVVWSWRESDDACVGGGLLRRRHLSCSGS